MDCNLISKTSLEELKDFLRIRDLKVNETKSELVARVIAASKNGVFAMLWKKLLWKLKLI